MDDGVNVFSHSEELDLFADLLEGQLCLWDQQTKSTKIRERMTAVTSTAETFDLGWTIGEC